MKKLLAFVLLLSAAAALTVSAGGPYNPRATVYYSVTGGVNNSGANITLSYPNSTNCSGYVDLPLVLNASGGSDGNFDLPALAQNGTWTLAVIDNSSTTASTNFVVNLVWAVPGLTANASSITLEKGNQTHVLLTVTDNTNTVDTINLAAGCPAGLTCSLNMNPVILGPGGSTQVLLTITAGQTAGAYQIQANATHQANSAMYATAAVSATVNPLHNFVLIKSGDNQSGETSVPYTLTANNTGEASTTYAITTTSACSASPASLTIGAGSSAASTVTVAIPSNAALNQSVPCNVTVTDAYGKAGTAGFTSYAAARRGVSVVGNPAYYAHPGDNYTLSIAINNTGNLDDNYNVTVVASSWPANVSNLNIAVSNLSSKNISLNVSVPANATACAYGSLTISAVSLANSSKTGSLATAVRVPCFTITPALALGNGALNVTIGDVKRDGTSLTGAQVQSLNYAIYYPNGSVATSSAIAFNTATQINVSNTTTWPSGTYAINSTAVDTDNFNGTQPGTFRIARSAYLTASTSTTSVAAAASFALTVESRCDSASGESFAPNTPSISSGSCGSVSGNGPYSYSCYFTSSGTQSITATSTLSSCASSGNLTCTLSPALSATASLTMTVTAAALQPITTITPTQTTNQTKQQQNATAAPQGAVNMTLPQNVTAATMGNLTIAVTNNNNESVSLNVTVEEKGKYAHFAINVTAPAAIAPNATANLVLSATPYPYARPGRYTATVSVNGQPANLTLVVPEPADNKSVHRYVDVAQNGSGSIVVFAVRNTGKTAKNITIRDTIPKEVANSTADIVFFNSTRYRYRVIKDDPVVEWSVILAPGSSIEIKYSVEKDLRNQTFNEPRVTEKSTEAQAEESTIWGTVPEAAPEASDLLKTVVIVGALVIGILSVYLKRVKIREISAGIYLPKLRAGASRSAQGLRALLRALRQRLRRRPREEHPQHPATEHHREEPQHPPAEQHAKEEPKHPEAGHRAAEHHAKEEPELTPYERALRKIKE